MPSTAERRDPFTAFRFEVRFDDLAPGGFTDCTGLQLDTEVMEYPEGGLNTVTHRFVTRTRQSNLTLRHGIVDRALWDWYWKLTQGEMRSRNATISVFDHDGQRVVMEWQIWRAYPIKWTGPELNAAQGAVAVEVLELCHQGLERRT
jgi:phage tail-like protein